MKDLLEVLARLWALVKKAPTWVKGVAAVVLFLGTAEIAQCGFLGSEAFWVAAPVAPWPQIFEPHRTLATTYTIQRPTDGAFAPLAYGASCPPGSKLDIAFERGGDGWVALAGWNAQQGFYPVLRSGLSAMRIEKAKTYAFRLNMDSSAGREYFLVIAGSKPFNAAETFQEIVAQLQAAAAEGKGGTPELLGSNLGRIDVGSLGSCVS